MNLTRILAFPFKNSRNMGLHNESYKISLGLTRILAYPFNNSQFLDFLNESCKISFIHMQEFSFQSLNYSILHDFFDS